MRIFYKPLAIAIKKIAGILGLDVIRLKNNPRHTWLSLGKSNFDVVVDVGANVGQFARQVRRRYPRARILALEPLPQPFEILQQWAAGQQGFVEVINAAASDSSGEVKMFSHVDHSPSSSLLQATARNHSLYPFTKNEDAVFVRMDPLDKILEGRAVTGNVLVKLDVQGFEDRVIRGASKTLKIASAVVVEISLEHLYEGQTSFREIFMLLDQLGFVYYGNLDQNYADDGHIIFFDAVFVKELSGKLPAKS